MIHDIEINSAAHYPAAGVIDLVELAEKVGFGAFWKGESNSTDPMILLSAAASRTKTIKLGTAIYHIYGRSPVTLGIQSATLQDLSGGRLLLGLGVANKSIAGWHGGVFDRPLRRAREYIDIVRKVAAGERVEYEGEIYQTGKRFQLSWKPSHPNLPIYLAGLGPQMTKLVGKISDGVFINMATPAKIREIAARVREGAKEAGRDPSKIEIMAAAPVWAAEDLKVARDRVRWFPALVSNHVMDLVRRYKPSELPEALTIYVKDRGGYDYQHHCEVGSDNAEFVSDEVVDRFCLVGPLKAHREKLERLARAGVTQFNIYLMCGDEEQTLETYGRDILPQLTKV